MRRAVAPLAPVPQGLSKLSVLDSESGAQLGRLRVLVPVPQKSNTQTGVNMKDIFRHYRLHCVPQNAFVQVLIPSTSECDYIWGCSL